MLVDAVSGRMCSVSGCDRQAQTRGMCQKHYMRVWYREDAERRGVVPNRIPGPCDVAGCGRPRRARGWCNTHYMRWLNTGDVDAARPVAYMPQKRQRLSPVQRVLRHVTVTPGNCWVYDGAVNNRGYGSTSVAGASVLTHRLVYEAVRGPIPEGLYLDHLCRVRACCNPGHLEPVTCAENNRRARAAKGCDL